jgi:hypothetical protein
MEKYKKVLTFCNENECTLLTTFEEFEIKRETVLQKAHSHVRIDFIGICGHASSAVVTNFLTRKTGIRCKECVRKNTLVRLKSNNNNITEFNSIKLIEEILSHEYTIIRTKEGCKADIIIHKKGIHNKYMPIQLKATEHMSHGMYSFRGINKEYVNMLLICTCITEKKIWVIPYNYISHLEYLNISARSKYNKYLIKDNNQLGDYLDSFDEEYYRSDIVELMKPISKFQAKEQEYVTKRETYINFLKYRYPYIQNTPTDFIINNKNMQEKVAGLVKNKGINILIAYLSSNNGKAENGARKFRTYRLGENDYYWIHSSIDDRFWIFPEEVLYNRGYISGKDETIKNKTIKISNGTIWIKEYEYNYKAYDKDKIIKLFE